MNVQIVLGTATIIAFAALLTAEPVASSDLTAAISDVKAHFSEQTALACFFANRSAHILPSYFLYDLASPVLSGIHEYAVSCASYLGKLMRKACILAKPEACHAFADRASYVRPSCQAVVRRFRSGDYDWHLVAPAVRAVH